MELRRSRSIAIWLGVSLAGYGVIMGLMYPIIKENDALMSQYMNTFPKEFLAAFGMTGVLSDPGVLYTTYISQLAVAHHGRRGRADHRHAGRRRRPGPWLPGPPAVDPHHARPVPVGLDRRPGGRHGAAGGVRRPGDLGAGRLVGAEFDLGPFALAGVLSLSFGCAILGATTLVAALTLSRGTTSGIVGGVLIVMYVIFVVAQISPDWAGWGRCPPGTTSRPPP